MALVMGSETEYAVCSPHGAGSSSRALEGLMCEVRSQNVVAPQEARFDYFLASGGRIYVDTGSHVEYASPECASPLDLVRWEKAGELILGAAADRVLGPSPEDPKLLLVKNNTMPGRYTGQSWGCHSNYGLHRAPTDAERELIIPHLVTRTIYSGAGRVSFGAGGSGYELSQRAAFISSTTGSDTTGGSRALYNTRDEPLASGTHHRAHIICGDSLRSHLGIFLKIGTTALLFALVTRRPELIDRRKVILKHPVSAFRGASFDIRGKAHCTLASGGPRLARTIQYAYLRAAESFVDAEPNPPSWMADVLKYWDMILTRHRQGPQALNTCLDAYIKHNLLTQILEENDFSWSQLCEWANVAEELSSYAVESEPIEVPQCGAAVVRRYLGAVLTAEVWTQVQALMAQQGLAWEELPHAFSVYRQVIAADIAYHAVGEGNLFDELDKAGLLEHRLLSDEEIRFAVTNPPSDTRASLRGAMIRRTAGHCEVYWTFVESDGSRIELPDPLQSSFTRSGQRELTMGF